MELKEFNAKRQRRFAISYPKPNGILCPKCRMELYDTDGNVLHCRPSRIRIHCENCTFKETRIK